MYAHEGGQDTHKGRRYWLAPGWIAVLVCTTSVKCSNLAKTKKSNPFYFLLVMSNNGRCYKIPQDASKLPHQICFRLASPKPRNFPVYHCMSKCRFVCFSEWRATCSAHIYASW